MITNVLEYLEKSAGENPTKIMMADSNKSITYCEVLNLAQHIGCYLINKLNCKNQPIFVTIDRDIESIVLFLGVVYSGNFYVPIDSSLPEIRLENMLNTIKPIAILGKNEKCAFDVTTEKFNTKYYSLNELSSECVDENSLINIRNESIDTDPLYAIFTSGSTGIPKAVLISHKSVIDLMNAFKKTFAFDESYILGNQAPFDFDVSVKDIYSTISNCATLQIIPKELFSFPAKLISYMNERRINTVIWATTALCIIANLRIMRKEKPQYLKNVFFSGEVMPIKVLNYWMDNLPAVRYVNLYGPTEITCNCTFFVVDKRYGADETLPIGKAFVNSDIIVLNDENHLVNIGEIGELCVRGSSLALGYYNNIAKTTECFCQNPLNANYPELIYRTGDLVKYDNDKNLVYCARKDFQIKHMGHRIELTEIEAAVDSIDLVERCCCIYDANNENIVLVYQSKELVDKDIIEYLTEVLPKYMMPSRYIKKDSMPLNEHLKIDRNLLKKEIIDITCD